MVNPKVGKIWLGELQRMKDVPESQASGTVRKRKRAKQEQALPLPSIQVQRTFGALGDINCSSHWGNFTKGSIADIILLYSPTVISWNHTGKNIASSPCSLNIFYRTSQTTQFKSSISRSFPTQSNPCNTIHIRSPNNFIHIPKAPISTFPHRRNNHGPGC